MYSSAFNVLIRKFGRLIDLRTQQSRVGDVFVLDTTVLLRCVRTRDKFKNIKWSSIEEILGTRDLMEDSTGMHNSCKAV